MTGYQSKKAAAQAKLVVTDIDGHIVRDVRKPKKAAAREPIGYAVPTFDFDNSVIKKVHYSGTVPLYTAPPQRPWVGLTDELQVALWEASRAGLPRFHTYATLIEKELRILNT